jgi:succinoglycan biosynthesis protein ExoA
VPTPSVTVLLPVLDEAGTIDACLASLAAQDYTGPISVAVADGGSRDGTLDEVGRWSGRLAIEIVPNPRRSQAHGLNVAAAAARGDILIRADGHTTYAPDYLRRSVDALLSSDAVAVGGRLTPEGRTPFGAAVAAAMTSPFGVGPGRFHHSDERGHVDTVYLGAFRRADLMSVGGFRAFPSGAVEDADLYFRWRQQGRKVLLDPSIRSRYRPRATPGALARQFFRYGQGKAEMLHVNGRWPSWRPVAPLLLLVGLVGFASVGASGLSWWPLMGLVCVWLLVVAAAAGRGARSFGVWARTAAAIAIMHLSYGIGLLGGLLHRPSSVRRAVSPAPLA